MKRTVDAEQFYTTAPAVQQCLALLLKHYQFDQFDLIVEPSAGAGAFLIQLPSGHRIGMDLFPNHEEVVQQDFLAWEPGAVTGRVLTIGNPPFGRRGKLAVQFIEKAATYSQVIAFILPRSFSKYTFQNRVPPNFHLVDSLECHDFETPDGEPLAINSVFQIWEKRPNLRALVKPQRTHPDFELKHAHLSRVTPSELAELQNYYDFAIAQVGKDFKPKPPKTLTKGSHWFIKASAPEVRERFEQLDFSFLDNMNTALTSISKADIVTAYNQTRN